MAFLPIALAVASAAVSTAGAFSQAQYQAAVASNNAKIAMTNSERSATTMQQQAQQVDNQYAQTKGQINAAYAGNNIDASSGSPQSVLAATTNNQGIDTQNIYAQGTAKVAGFQQQAANFTADATQAKTKGIFALVQGGLKVAGSLADANVIGGSGSSMVGNSGSSMFSGIPKNWQTISGFGLG